MARRADLEGRRLDRDAPPIAVSLVLLVLLAVSIGLLRLAWFFMLRD